MRSSCPPGRHDPTAIASVDGDRSGWSEARRQQMALAAAGIGTWTIDLALSEACFDPRASDLFGFGPAGTTQTTYALFDRIHPTDRPYFAEALGQSRIDLELRLFGSEVAALRLIGGLVEGSERTRLLAGTLQPTTGDEARLRMILDASSDGTWEWDLVTRTLYLSETWLSHLGYDNAAAFGGIEYWDRIIHPEDRAHVRDGLVAHLRGETDYYESESRVRARDGQWRWTLTRGRVVARDQATGAGLRLIGTHKDISHRKAAEQAPSFGEAPLPLRLEDHPDQFALLGVIPPCLGEICQCVEVTVNWSGGDKGQVPALPAPECPEGACQRLPTTVHDMGRCRQSTLLHVARLSDMGAMSAIASTLAHELNQPLTAITNYLKGSKRLLEAHGSTMLPVAIEALDGAATQSLRAGQIVQRLRALIACGEVEKRVERLDRLIEEAHALARSVVQDVRLDCQLMLDPAADHVLVDRIQIQQVLVNLIRNAAEAMADSPVPTLEIRTERRPPGLITISVSDSGPGISPAIRDRLFVPFVSTKKHGMGVGLSICRMIVEAHGGQLWAEDRAGWSASFCFTLPHALDADMRGEPHPANKLPR